MARKRGESAKQRIDWDGSLSSEYFNRGSCPFFIFSLFFNNSEALEASNTCGICKKRGDGHIISASDISG